MTVVRDAQLAAAIADAHGLHAPNVTPIVGAGSVNHIFVVRTGEVALVVRFAIDTAREDSVDLEAWALTQAGCHGIPSPSVVATGHLSGVPYLVQAFVEGVNGTERRSLQLWRTLGEYASKAHAIPVTADAPDALFSRFGRDLPQAWQAHLRYNMDQLVETDPLIQLGVYEAAQQSTLRARITKLQATDLTFGLNHGDLSMRNLLVPEQGVPVLIDWGSARAGPSPFLDFMNLRTAHHLQNDPSDQELLAFADGYGVSLDNIEETLENLTVLEALDLVRWAIDQRPDLLEQVVESARWQVATHAPPI
jgi:aminoglycoside phosphotransferase (APT) family kinase protein